MAEEAIEAAKDHNATWAELVKRYPNIRPDQGSTETT